MERLNRKFETARSFVPRPEVDTGKSKIGIIGYGTSHWGLIEAPRPVAPGIQHRD